MAYCTRADLVDRFGELELTQITGRGLGPADESMIAQAIADADAEIDGYLAGRYTLPLASVPAILVGYGCDLARYRLYKDAAPEEVEKRAERAVRFLALVAQGKITLGVQPEPETLASGGIGGGVAVAKGTTVFGADILS